MGIDGRGIVMKKQSVTAKNIEKLQMKNSPMSSAKRIIESTTSISNLHENPKEKTGATK